MSIPEGSSGKRHELIRRSKIIAVWHNTVSQIVAVFAMQLLSLQTRKREGSIRRRRASFKSVTRSPSDKKFQQYFRVSRSAFRKLLNLVRPALTKNAEMARRWTLRSRRTPRRRHLLCAAEARIAAYPRRATEGARWTEWRVTDHSEIRLACIVELRAKHGLNFTVKLGNVSKIKTFYIKLATSSQNRRELARSPSGRSASYFSTRFIKFYIKNFLCPVSGGPNYDFYL